MKQPFEMQLTQCLQNAQSTDKATREQAEAYIRRIEEENWGAFVAGLSQELINESNPDVSRQMAGLLLKNALDAKDSHVQVRERH
jgi:importin subunit beta-1